MSSRGLILVGLAPALLSAAPAGEEAGQHGAAAMDRQRQVAAALIGTVPAGAPPGIDGAVWKQAVAPIAPRPELVALGERLYFETALSLDGTVACATCHDSTRSFTDRRNVSEGVADKLGRRNAPTTMNAVLLQTQFWDGRAANLVEQAKQPILNSVEMAHVAEKDVVVAVRAAGYEPSFREVFGRDVTYADLATAIAAYETTLIFLDAPFDSWVGGDDDAISTAAQRGFELFAGKARCAACHPIHSSNPLGTDNRFHNIGVAAHAQDFESLAAQALVALAKDDSMKTLDELAVGTDLSELGRFMVTRNRADVGAFRTPQLRNAGITGPYMHDGSMQTLWDVMDHYNKGGEVNRWLDGGIEPLALTEPEIDDVVAFLFTLTDHRFDRENAEDLERQRTRSTTDRPFRDDALAKREVLPFERRATGAGGE